jgi:hypothetical protein
MRSRIWPAKSLEGTVMTTKVRSHSPVVGLRQFLPQPSQTKWWAILHGYGCGLFGPCALDGTPLKKAIDRYDAAPLTVSVREHRKP